MPKVLIVEDEPLVALSLRMSLEEAGVEVIDAVEDADSAMAAARADRPDLALVDIRLRGEEDGISLARRLKGELGVEVVFVTAQGDAGTRREAMALDPAGYVLKPYDPDVLVALVHATLAEAD